ncbi:MAG: MFS transporter [Deltaproteobacteria bacterium]|nr:MFS transporter [Deltaproteobacteria bacterium]
MISPLVLKLGLVRFATSLLVVLLVNVLNRVLMVELGVPAQVVTFCFAFQHVMTPAGLVSGYYSDSRLLAGRHRTPYLWGGMLLSMAVMPFFPPWAQALGAAPHDRTLIYLGVLLFSLFGIGTTVSATAINSLLVDQVEVQKRGSALTVVWILTLAGFIAGSALIDVLPTSDPHWLNKIFGLVTLIVALTTWLAARGVEPPCATRPTPHAHRQRHLWPVLKFLGSHRQTLCFFGFLGATIFFLAIQTFLLTAFGGEVWGLPLAQTNKFGIYTSYGVIIAMVVGQSLLVRRSRRGDWSILVLSLLLGALTFALLSLTAFRPDLTRSLYVLGLLGFSRGLYNVGISHLTMSFVHPAFSGIFMGLWNLVSGLALAAGEMAGGILKDQIFSLVGKVNDAYGWIFLIEGVGLLFCLILLVPMRRGHYHFHLDIMFPKNNRLKQPG